MDCCAYCKTDDVKLMYCGRCGLQPYCSKQCQKKDWKNHKIVCARKKIGSKEAKPSESFFFESRKKEELYIRKVYKHLKSIGKHEEAEAYKRRLAVSDMAMKLVEEGAEDDEKMLRALSFFSTHYCKEFPN